MTLEEIVKKSEEFSDVMIDAVGSTKGMPTEMAAVVIVLHLVSEGYTISKGEWAIG